MTSTFRLALFALPLLWPVPPAAAQGTPDVRQVEVRFACLRFAGDLRSVLTKPKPDQDPEELRLYQGGFGQPVTLMVENGSVSLYVRGESPDPKKPVFTPVATAAVPAQGREFTILLLPKGLRGEDAGPGYQPVVLPADKAFPFGDAMLLNLTKWNVRFDIGKKASVVSPNSQALVRFKGEVDEFNTAPVAVNVQTAPNQSLTLHTTRWIWHERTRHLAIVWLNHANQRPEITTLKEIKGVEVPKPKDGGGT